MTTRIQVAKAEDLPDVLRLTLLLWPDVNPEEIQNQVEGNDASQQVILLCHVGEIAAGVAYVSLRSDYVEGGSSSPIGYLEGIYVAESHRRTGVATQLIREAELWCKQFGCRELGSDTEIANTFSQEFHEASGFQEVARIVHYLKPIT